MPASVVSLTVSGDASDPIASQVEALWAVAPALSEIVLVDACVDQSLAARFARGPCPVKMIQASRDQGVAGAWASGLEYVVSERRHDWVWVLDPASLPGTSTLADLVTVSESLAAAVPLGVLAPMPARPGAVYPGLRWRAGTPPLDQDAGDLPVEFVDAVTLAGSLVSVAAVRAAGLPRRDFFIDVIDFELCLRIRRAGFQVGVVPGTAMAAAPRSAAPLTGFGPSGAGGGQDQPWREYYKARNLTFTVWREFPSIRARLRLVGHLLGHAAAVVLHDPQKQNRLTLIARGVRDGLRGALGRRVEPVAPTGL